MSQLTFFFDYSSPYAYLAATQVERVAGDHAIHWHPFFLGGLFKAIGTPMVPLSTFAPAKQRYAMLDMGRWADHHGVPFAFPSRFPMNTIAALRMTVQLANAERGKLAVPMFKAYWAEDRDINDEAELIRIADDAGLDGKALYAGCSEPTVKEKLKDLTVAAEEAGVCGAPSFLVKDGDEKGMLFWGQDRLDFVEKALSGWRPACG